MLIPETARWWLDYYAGLARHLREVHEGIDPSVSTICSSSIPRSRTLRYLPGARDGQGVADADAKKKADRRRASPQARHLRQEDQSVGKLRAKVASVTDWAWNMSEEAQRRLYEAYAAEGDPGHWKRSFLPPGGRGRARHSP